MTQKDELKVCTACGESKAKTEFYNKGNRLDSRCKSCVLAQKSKIYNAKKKASPKRRTKARVIDYGINVVGLPDIALLAHRISIAIGGNENE